MARGFYTDKAGRRRPITSGTGRRRGASRLQSPSKLHYLTEKPNEIPEDEWHGAGNYYKHSNGHWVKYSREADRIRGGKVGSGPYRMRHDAPSLSEA